MRGINSSCIDNGCGRKCDSTHVWGFLNYVDGAKCFCSYVNLYVAFVIRFLVIVGMLGADGHGYLISARYEVINKVFVCVCMQSHDNVFFQTNQTRTIFKKYHFVLLFIFSILLLGTWLFNRLEPTSASID